MTPVKAESVFELQGKLGADFGMQVQWWEQDIRFSELSRDIFGTEVVNMKYLHSEDREPHYWVHFLR